MRGLIAALLTMLSFGAVAQTVNELPLVLNSKATAATPSGITYISSSSAQAVGNGATLTISKPTTATNDVMIAFVATNFTFTGQPSGWTEINMFSSTGNIHVSYHVSTGGSEPANYSWVGDSPRGIIRDYRNVSISAPIDASSGHVDWSGAATSCQIPAMSNAVQASEVYVGTWDSAAGHTITIPGGFGNAVISNSNAYIVSADFTLGPAGSTVAAQTATFAADFSMCAGVTLKQ